MLFISVPAMGQSAPDATEQSPPPVATESDAAPVAEPDAGEAPDASSGEDWRDTSGYPFPALADTVAAAQNMVHAMLLREYCANKKLPDDFVRGRLARFSRITGREEDCQSLLDYGR
ncbi:MAG: hypothetical protein FWH56_10495 [Betaproteobacteria bacterium]|nr:hypothetical protein [Betaproteobacteria bacterium]